MKTKGIFVLGLALLSSAAVLAQGGRPGGGRPVNPGQERAAEVKLRNTENKAARAESHADKRQHGEAAAQSRAHDKALKNANENAALKGSGKTGAEGDHNEHAEKRREGERKKDGEMRKDDEGRKGGEKRKDGEKRKGGNKPEGKGTNG